MVAKRQITGNFVKYFVILKNDGDEFSSLGELEGVEDFLLQKMGKFSAVIPAKEGSSSYPASVLPAPCLEKTVHGLLKSHFKIEKVVSNDGEVCSINDAGQLVGKKGAFELSNKK